MKALSRAELQTQAFGHRPTAERPPTGAYAVEKNLDGTWTPMSRGDGRDGLERLIRCAEAVGGEVRIVRHRDGVVVWERKVSLRPVVSEEGGG